MLGLTYNVSVYDALETMALTRPNAFAPNLWSIETFLHKLANNCHIGQINDWHRLYIESTCASIMMTRSNFCDELPNAEFSIPLAAYVLAIVQSQYGTMSVIQCFRYGMMNYIHGVYGTSEDLVKEAKKYWGANHSEQKQRVKKKAKHIHSKQISNVAGKNSENSFETGEA